MRTLFCKWVKWVSEIKPHKETMFFTPTLRSTIKISPKKLKSLLSLSLSLSLSLAGDLRERLLSSIRVEPSEGKNSLKWIFSLSLSFFRFDGSFIPGGHIINGWRGRAFKRCCGAFKQPKSSLINVRRSLKLCLPLLLWLTMNDRVKKVAH